MDDGTSPPGKRSRREEQRLVKETAAALGEKEEKSPADAASIASKMTRKIIFVSPTTHRQVIESVQDIVGDEALVEQILDLKSFQDSHQDDIECVISTYQDDEQVDQVKEWCQKHSRNFFWAQAFNDYLSVNSWPSKQLIDNYKGQNPRPDNDLLLTEELCQSESGSCWKITCAKKHHLLKHDRISIEIKGKIIKTMVSEVTSEKSFQVEEELLASGMPCHCFCTAADIG